MAIYLGVFLVTLSGLMFEIGLTRIYSATIWYHFAFVAISVALLGWGLGGLALHLLEAVDPPTLEQAAVLSALYAAEPSRSALWLIVRSRSSSIGSSSTSSPRCCRSSSPAWRCPWSSTCGARSRRRSTSPTCSAPRSGALVVTLLLQAFGGETTVLVAAVAPLVAGACVLAPAAGAAGDRRRGRARRRGLTNEQHGLFHVDAAEQGHVPAHGRAAAARRSRRRAGTRTRASTRSTGFEPPYLARLYIDSDAWTNVLQWDGDSRACGDYRTWYRALPFKLVQAARRRSIIGPGGGSDVLVALAAGSKKVTAVELNPLMLKLRPPLRRARGQLYDRPDVEVVQSEGRTFISRTDRRFDVILLGFVDSWASVASGGLSLSENHLYTIEGFRGLLRPPDRRRDARDPAMGRGHPAARDELGRAAGRRGGGQADRRPAREGETARRTRRR